MTRPDNIIRIPTYSGTKPDSAAGGTRHHCKRHELLPQESPRFHPHSAPRGGSFSLDEVVIWLSIFGLILLGGFFGGFHG